jgi:DNA polymerase-1
MVNSYGTDKAEDVFKLIKPFELFGRKFLILDTEDYPTSIANHDIPYNVVRRWVGKGKQAHPVDLPFCMSFCDGVNMITLYDTLENNYAELRKMSVWLEALDIEKVFHNTKFDMHMLANVGIKMAGKLHDTVVMTKLANENRMSFALKDIAEKHPQGQVKFEYMVDAYKKNNKIKDYRHIPRELMTEYANADVWNCYIVFMEAFKVLVTDELTELYDQELELMIALWVMERFGMKARKDYEIPLKAELQKLSDDAERAVYDAVGYPFNMNSNQQIHKALMSMGVDEKVFKFTDKGNIKMDKKEFERLESLGIDLVIKIGEFRKYEKLLGTYANGIYLQMDSVGKVHGSINQTEASTGRMSITKPALQTLPKKDKRIRGIFEPTEGFRLWFMDLDQVEYRLLAHYAQAKDLIEAIKNGHDIHAATAATIFDKPIEDVTEDERQKAKTVNFSLVYGQGDEASANSLKMTIADARRFKNKYFSMLPEVLPFIQTVHAVVRTKGFVRNWYGRRRRLTSNEAYKAPNALIQGCAADYIKKRVVLMYKFLMAHEYKSRLVNIVHDELLPEIHHTEEFLAPKLRWLMSDFETFRVPITAGAEYSDENWGAKVAPEQDIGFDPLTEAETEAMMNFNVFDGSAFDLVA